jgi:hypothetical protein
MSSTIVQRPMQPLSDWRPSAAELEAIVAEMRPLIAALASAEGRRLDSLCPMNSLCPRKGVS